jgi:hypothetical protein
MPSVIQSLRGLYAKHLLHLDCPTDIDGFLAFVELLFHSIITIEPITLELGGRTTPAPIWVTRADVANGGIESRQGIICVNVETKNESSRHTRAEEAMELGDLFSPPPTIVLWRVKVCHEIGL